MTSVLSTTLERVKLKKKIVIFDFDKTTYICPYMMLNNADNRSIVVFRHLYTVKISIYLFDFFAIHFPKIFDYLKFSHVVEMNRTQT